jgi:3-oxoacyl-[acyl-carrier protein] reductase
MINKRIAVVTGAGQGIGLESSKALLSNGHFVVMVDRKPFDGAALVGSEHAPSIMAHTLDVTDDSGVVHLHQMINATLGKVSVLVNNAGISPKQPDGKSSGILQLDPKEWASVIEVNLTAVMRMCQVFIPDMQALKYGRIVSISSLAGRSKSVVAGPSYMASKAGVLGLTRAIASEMGPFGITANCVAPGRILTEMAMQAGEEVNRRYAEQIPVKRIGTAQEVGKTVAFLCEESSGFINGATIDINGGFFMS